jgi:hypothetical protein
MLENTEGAIQKNWQHGCTQDEEKHNTISQFWFIWPSGFRGEDLKKSVNQKQELPVVAMFVNGSG